MKFKIGDRVTFSEEGLINYGFASWVKKRPVGKVCGVGYNSVRVRFDEGPYVFSPRYLEHLQPLTKEQVLGDV